MLQHCSVFAIQVDIMQIILMLQRHLHKLNAFSRNCNFGVMSRLLQVVDSPYRRPAVMP